MKALKNFARVLPLTLLAACSASVKGGGEVPDLKPAPFDHAVVGPALDGHWVSGCEDHKWGSDYVRFDMTVSGQNVNRIETLYSDAACTTSTATVTRVGWFRFKEDVGSGIYEVEYKYASGGGHYYTGENVRLSSGNLWISDRYVGSFAVPDIELFPAPSLSEVSR